MTQRSEIEFNASLYCKTGELLLPSSERNEGREDAADKWAIEYRILWKCNKLSSNYDVCVFLNVHAQIRVYTRLYVHINYQCA